MVSLSFQTIKASLINPIKDYSENDLHKLPLRIKANNANVKIAEEAIRKNKSFLEKIPPRLNPHIPAHVAGKFSFGWCAVLAEVIKEMLGLPAVAIIATKFTESANLTPLGYVHSVNLHPDGEVEDSWGKQSLANILDRFGVLEYTLSEEVQCTNNESLKKNSPELYNQAYLEALSFII
ncbi:hypothetical protein [Mucilaginibacter lappiensis]|uniref:Uncharacterized protein n=1 Tax=Mucilaginibacter lappiensis TaxID=354630 RepID=A0A841JHC9_9SPHI|nr:hypothetical protein [Mucilaginibacter lappiensis]MBB6127431.1 hypothetical protein [Mucilaginibacter lappiensis]